MDHDVRGSAGEPLRVRTLFVDVDTNGEQLAWVEGAVWPPIGSAVEVPTPLPRDAVVRRVRLQLPPPGHEYAVVLVHVKLLAGLVEYPEA